MVEGGCALVAFPRTTEDVVACVRVAAEHGLSVVPRGSGTGLAGAATPIGDALVVVLSKMNGILEVRPDDRLAWVEPGLFNLDLSTALRPMGWTYAPDPSSQQASSIGGNVNTNAGGPHCLAYGVTSAHVLALDSSCRRQPSYAWAPKDPRRPGTTCGASSSGARERWGSWRASASGSPGSRPRSARCCSTSWSRACAATVSAIIARGVVPAAIEMMDHGIVVAAENFAHAGYPTDAAAILIVEVDGLPSAVEAADARGRGRRARERRPHDPGGGRRRRARAVVEGAQVGVRRRGADRPPLPPARLRRPAHQARGGADRRLRDRETPRPDRHERLPRRRREPPPAVLVRPDRARHAGARAGGERRGRPAVRRRGRRAERRARHRPGEARLHAAGVHRRRSGRAGVRPRRVRSRVTG